jgi:hypothetical protein
MNSLWVLNRIKKVRKAVNIWFDFSEGKLEGKEINKKFPAFRLISKESDLIGLKFGFDFLVVKSIKAP